MRITEEQYQDIVAQQARKINPVEAQRQPLSPETFRQKLERLREQGFKARAEERAKRPKPDRNAPNKTELRFEQEILKPSLPAEATYGFQRLTFLLAPGLRYTPDWIAWQESDFSCEHGWLTCYEVKGAHVWEDSKIKFLTAREIFPWVEWRAYQWKNKTWSEIWAK
jgi:hypothetical protein